MYEPKWPFLLMYGCHDMRHTGFTRVDGLSTDPRDLRRHTNTIKERVRRVPNKQMGESIPKLRQVSIP